VSEESRRPAPPDVEVGAAVRMKKVRFKEKPEVETRTHVEPGGGAETQTERENLPDEVEPGKTYRNASIRKQTEIRLDERE
jgi:hypothetical protein